MKAKITVEKIFNEWKTTLKIDNQKFLLAVKQTKTDAQWMAEMLKIALEKLGVEVEDE